MGSLPGQQGDAAVDARPTDPPAMSLRPKMLTSAVAARLVARVLMWVASLVIHHTSIMVTYLAGSLSRLVPAPVGALTPGRSRLLMIHRGMSARVEARAERPVTFFEGTTGGAGRRPEAGHRDPEEKKHDVWRALPGLARAWGGHAVCR